MKVVIGTSNSHKFKEIASMISKIAPNMELILPEGKKGPLETGKSFRENALLKAEYYSRIYRLPTIAEDSGLCVDALGGRPGIHSSRFAGRGGTEENIKKLLHELDKVPILKRKARFVCCAVFFDSENRIYEAEGYVEGLILHERRGNGGFGYDPVFFYPPFGKTFSELSSDDKNRVSHRAKALVALLVRLKSDGII